MSGWRRDDPFQLDLDEQHRREAWPVRDSTAGVATHHHQREAEPNVLAELKLLAVAAVVGMSLAVATVFALRAMTSPGVTAEAPPATAEPSPAAVEAAHEAPVDVDEAPMIPARAALASIAASAGAMADRGASEAAPAIAEDLAEARASAADAREAALAEAEEQDDSDAEVSEDAESIHAATGDDIIDLDEDDDEPDDDEGADAEDANASWSEVQNRYDRLIGKRSTDRKKKKREKKKREKKKREKKKREKKEAKAKTEDGKSAAPSGPAGEFDRDAATSAMFAAAGGASGCATAGGPTGRGRVSVTLSPSGRVSSVDVGGPFGSTKTGSCIASLFRSVSVPPFKGGAISLQKSFNVRAAKASKSADDDEPKKKKAKKAKAKKKKRRRGRRRGRADR